MISSQQTQQFAGTREQITKSLWSRRTSDFESARMRRSGPGEAVLSLRSKKPMDTGFAPDHQQIDGPEPSAHPATLAQREHNLRETESRLLDRERLMGDAEARMAERERELWEAEALFEARKDVSQAREETSDDSSNGASSEALDTLKATLEEQEKSLLEAKTALKEREEFLEASENKLFEKLQAQQEREIELEQWAEELGDKESTQKSGSD
ncbi:MAG: hypothetical protein DRP71_13980 [Verrucomicrobia bacterium]|nr:MAG: hypothetical protein DRP71_13980 [Verrucomicrobiota bacterium]